MADLDAELLALAGGDSSGEESISSPPRKKSPSPRHSTKQVRDSSPTDMGHKGIAKTTKKVKRRKTYSDDEDDLSVHSQHSDSASMSQSASEAEFVTAEDKPIFPYEKLYFDAKDKARIQAKPEIEREEILAQRSEQVERHEQDLTLRRLIAAKAKEEAKQHAKNKRKASSADLEESQRKSSRQRTKLGGGRAGEASTAIEAYKQQRAERTAREQQRKKDAANRKTLSPKDDLSDMDAEADSDNDFDDHRNRKPSRTPPRDDPIAELTDIQRATVGRENFAEVCWTPGFEAAITNCYARVCLGPGRDPNVNEYRLCLIKGFQKGKPYAMTGPNKRIIPVDTYITAAHGKAERPWSFLECSMSKINDDEWRRYRVTMANEDIKMPTKSFINSKLAQIHQLLAHRYTEAEIDEKLKKQKAITDMVNRTKEKEEIRYQIELAEIAGNYDIIPKLEEQLARIIPVKLAFGTSLIKPENTYVNKDQERLAEVNLRNLRMNAENVRKAQLAELKAKKPKKHLAPGVDDLFEGGSDISRAGTPVNGHRTPNIAANISRSGTPNPLMMANGTPKNGTPRSSTPVLGAIKPTEKRRGLTMLRKDPTESDIIANMELGLDIDI